MLKLLLSGHSAACLAKLRKEGLHHGLLPLLDVIVEQPQGERFLRLALEQTDTRIQTGKSVSPAFLFAALLWHEVLAAWKINESKDMRGIPALYLASNHDHERNLGAAAAPGTALGQARLRAAHPPALSRRL
jgi:poly(A) polymerase